MSTEADLRGLHRPHDPDPAFVDRLRARVEVAVTDTTVDEEQADDAVIRLDAPVAGRRGHRRGTGFRVAAAIVLIAAVGGVVWAQRDEPDATISTEGAAPPYVGTWVSTDSDGSTQTMEIVDSGENGYEIVVLDDAASVCSGAPSTMTGAGRLGPDRSLVVARPTLECDDGTTPEALEGALDELLADLTFRYVPATDELDDSLGVVWWREGAEEPPVRSIDGDTWPQSTFEEQREAQRLADADDPRYTWQVDPELAGENDPRDNELVTRFLREELGWESHIPGGDGWAGAPGIYEELVYIRCAPGGTNPFYPDDPRVRGCTPTIDDSRYETVQLGLSQPVRRGSTGIWVVHRWEIIDPVVQVEPLSDAEVTTVLQDFLGARVAGEGAEEHIQFGELPLLYTTTTGAPYERFEIETLDDERAWPIGRVYVTARLFADGGETVVEQVLAVRRDGDGVPGVSLSSGEHEIAPTTEDGAALPEPHSLFDGMVTLGVPWPWTPFGPGVDGRGEDLATLLPEPYGGASPPNGIALVVDPFPFATGCRPGPAPADAAALAEAVATDPGLRVGEPVATTVAGVDAIRVDVRPVRSGSDECTQAVVVIGDPPGTEPRGVHGEAVRLFLLDTPGDPGRTLAVAVFAEEARVEEIVAAAEPILASLEVHP